MTDAELLQKVKEMLFGTSQGEWRDDLLALYIGEVKEFMRDAGVSNEKLASAASVGCIAIGVNDLWNYESGGARFSEYFKMRVTQLATGA